MTLYDTIDAGGYEDPEEERRRAQRRRLAEMSVEAGAEPTAGDDAPRDERAAAIEAVRNASYRNFQDQQQRQQALEAQSGAVISEGETITGPSPQSQTSTSNVNDPEANRQRLYRQAMESSELQAELAKLRTPATQPPAAPVVPPVVPIGPGGAVVVRENPAPVIGAAPGAAPPAAPPAAAPPVVTGPKTGTPPNAGSPGGNVPGAQVPTGPVGGTPPPAAPGPTGVDNLAGGIGSGGTIAELTKQITADLSGIQSEIANAQSPDVMGMFLRQGQSIIDLITKQEQDLRARAEAEGSTIDPATQFTLDTLREQLDKQLKSTRENLNSRGLYDSGILLELEGNVRKGNLSDQARILGDRLSRIQKDLSDRLTGLGNKRVDTASQYGLRGLEGQLDADRFNTSRKDDLVGQLASRRMQLRGALSGEARDDRDFDFRRSESTAQRALREREMSESQRRWQEEYDRDKAKFNIEQTYRQDQDALARQDAINRLAQQRVGGTTSGGTTRTTTGTGSTDATSRALSVVSTYSDRATAIADFNANARAMAAAGVDIAAVRQRIDEHFAERTIPVSGPR